MNAHAMYNEIQNLSEQDLVTQHAKLVKRIAFHMMNRLPPVVQAEDLIQAGMIGMIEAAKHYDPSQGASFETYAGIRVRGAMLDEIRRSDWTPRSVHRKSREAAEAIRNLEQNSGEAVRDEEVARQMGVTIKEYHQVLAEQTSARVFSLDQPDDNTGETIALPASNEPSPEDNLHSHEFQARLASEIENLPERESLVMSLYYTEEMNLREIGIILGVSESRVCQIHGQAILRLRGRLTD